MKLLHLVGAGLLAAGLAGTASAQEATDTSTRGPIPVRGNVPALCSGGTLGGGGTAFEVGILINTSTGFLLPNLSAPPKTLTGAFCSSKSAITIVATPMTAQNFTATPPANFSRTVNYDASAAGWTTSPAVFSTGAASNPNATQQRATAFTGDITVSVSNFTTGGGDALRMVADPVYLGTVVVTLAVVS
jgi:hypothetical protein